MCGEPGLIEPIEPADEEINHWLEAQEKLHKEIAEAMRLPDEFFDKSGGNNEQQT